MFTGIVTDIGTIDRIADTPAGRELRVRCGFEDLEPGESMALNGVCLTVREAGGGSFACAAMSATIEATSVSDWRPGKRVNLERALKAGDRLGGHIVQGHVDATARVTSAEELADTLVIDLALPGGLSELMVERGSVAVDGVSLTIAALPAPDVIRLAIIEFTRRNTTLGDLRVGDTVNVEADVIGKHVRRMLAPHRDP